MNNNLECCPICKSRNVHTAVIEESPIQICVVCPDCGTTFTNEHVEDSVQDTTVWWNNEVPRQETCHIKISHGDICSNCGKEYDLNLYGSFGSYDGVQAAFCPFCGAEVIGIGD